MNTIECNCKCHEPLFKGMEIHPDEKCCEVCSGCGLNIMNNDLNEHLQNCELFLSYIPPSDDTNEKKGHKTFSYTSETTTRSELYQVLDDYGAKGWEVYELEIVYYVRNTLSGMDTVTIHFKMEIL